MGSKVCTSPQPPVHLDTAVRLRATIYQMIMDSAVIVDINRELNEQSYHVHVPVTLSVFMLLHKPAPKWTTNGNIIGRAALRT